MPYNPYEGRTAYPRHRLDEMPRQGLRLPPMLPGARGDIRDYRGYIAQRQLPAMNPQGQLWARGFRGIMDGNGPYGWR